MTNKSIIKLISDTYRYHKNYIEESEYLMINKSITQVAISQKICSHIEHVVYNMEEKYSIILQNDVIKGLMNKKYRDGCSKSTYYRNREAAYEKFIKELNK